MKLAPLASEEQGSKVEGPLTLKSGKLEEHCHSHKGRVGVSFQKVYLYVHSSEHKYTQNNKYQTSFTSFFQEMKTLEFWEIPLMTPK